MFTHEISIGFTDEIYFSEVQDFVNSINNIGLFETIHPAKYLQVRHPLSNASKRSEYVFTDECVFSFETKHATLKCVCSGNSLVEAIQFCISRYGFWSNLTFHVKTLDRSSNAVDTYTRQHMSSDSLTN